MQQIPTRVELTELNKLKDGTIFVPVEQGREYKAICKDRHLFFEKIGRTRYRSLKDGSVSGFSAQYTKAWVRDNYTWEVCQLSNNPPAQFFVADKRVGDFTYSLICPELFACAFRMSWELRLSNDDGHWIIQNSSLILPITQEEAVLLSEWKVI